MNKFTRFLSKNRPSILTFVGIGGLIGTAIMAYKSYPVVADSISESQPSTKRETALVYVKKLWPTFALGGLSTVLIVLGNKDHINRRNAALAAYYISESTLKDYQAEMVKELGEKTEKQIRDKVAEKRSNDIPANDSTIIISNQDKPWVCDTATGCFFRISYEKLRRIIAEANLELFKRDYISVADLYEMMEVALPPGGDWFRVGWNARSGEIDPYFTSTVREINGETVPCMILEYRVKPFYDYDVYERG